MKFDVTVPCDVDIPVHYSIFCRDRGILCNLSAYTYFLQAISQA
jgi:hypothetical protein